MSVLQQRDSQGELRVANIRKEGATVRRGRTGCTKGRERLPCKLHRNEGLGELRRSATQWMNLTCDWLESR